jgi:cation diffusion facilitator family transporter
VNSSESQCAACDGCVRSVGAVSIGGNLGLAVIKGFLGVVGGSQALIADAVHSLADLISSGLLVVGLRVAARPADAQYQYGYGKAEFIVAVGIFTLLLAAGGFIFYDSFHMVIHGEKVNPSLITVFGALLSIVGNELMFRQSFCAGRRAASPAMIANSTEKRADVLSSLAVLVGIVGAKCHLYVLDPLAAILVACLILHSSLKGIWEALQGLMDCALPPRMMEAIATAVRGVPGVAGLGRVRSRELGQTVAVELEILTDGNQTLEQAEQLRAEISRAASRCVERPGEFLVHLRPRSTNG